jgi:hypothetical protein
MNTTKKLSKFLTIKICEVATHIAYTSTEACTALNFQEPKMPKSLLKKAK